MSNSPHSQLTDRRDTEIAQYRSLNVTAVVGLLLGLLAPLALIHPVLWIVPPLGIIGCSAALWQIARNSSALCGRRVALAGLVLSIVFGIVAPTHLFAYRWLIRNEARQFALAWFEFLGRGEPHKARLMIPNPRFRPPLTDQVWDIYREDPSWREKLQEYVSRPLIRTLLALGDKARVRYYDTTRLYEFHRDIFIHQTYAVTYDEDGREKTFFVGLTLKRVELPDGTANWELFDAEGGGLPEGIEAG